MAWASKRSSLKRGKSPRKVWLFDSFDGFSAFKEEDGTSVDRINIKPADVSNPREIAEQLGVSEQVQIVKGWAQDTLPAKKQDIGKIAILRLDLDIYEPTKVALETLYDSVVKGGYVVIDDYDFEGCRKAIDEFRQARNIAAPLQKGSRLEKEYWVHE